jgi:hypothetical protein
MTELWDERAEAYRQSKTHAEGADLDLVVEWCAPGPGRKVLDVATGGGHVARDDVVGNPSHLFDCVAYVAEVVRRDPRDDAIEQAVRKRQVFSARDMREAGCDVVTTDSSPGMKPDIAEKLRDPTHVRNYTEDEWGDFLTGAGLEVEQRQLFEKVHPLEDWLARTGCVGEEAERVKELLSDRMTDDRTAWTDVKLILKARKSQS